MCQNNVRKNNDKVENDFMRMFRSLGQHCPKAMFIMRICPEDNEEN